MVSYINKGNRNQLSPTEKDFLTKLIPTCRLINEWVINKSIFIRKRINNSILTSVVAVDIITESLWGAHPLAQPFFNKKYCNNLANLEVNDYWQGRSTKFNSKEYKCYQDWLHFATDYSDMLVFTKMYDDLLSTSNYKDQIRSLARHKEDPQMFIPKAEALYEYYRLSEFD